MQKGRIFMSHNIKKHFIYKMDKWNMMFVEEDGKSLVLREISDQWGEECHTFLSRPAMLQWAEERFSDDHFQGSEEEKEMIMNAFKQI